jgi:hypothetical protein
MISKSKMLIQIGKFVKLAEIRIYSMLNFALHVVQSYLNLQKHLPTIIHRKTIKS